MHDTIPLKQLYRMESACIAQIQIDWARAKTAREQGNESLAIQYEHAANQHKSQLTIIQASIDNRKQAVTDQLYP